MTTRSRKKAETVTESTTGRTRTASPYTTLKKAKARLEKARKDVERVTVAHEHYEVAKREYDAALDALRADLGELPELNTDSVQSE